MAAVIEIEPAPMEAAGHMASLHDICFATLPETPWSAHAFRAIMRAPTNRTLMARGSGGKMVGLLVGGVGGGEAEILSICVSPAVRRAGIARALLVAFLSDLPPGTRSLLEVAVDNLAAISLYESCDFSEVGRRPNYYAGGKTKVDAIIYARIEQ